ncbi:hypothetical protein [Eubacterium oxidoreducens]|uniref:Uncharacterized protein n=1 Tax=Eubacterium oxidoreducens TaxID=1732 RepID=A0A1G6AWA1_EUBOX|nr:hypothetical protein [Eubacterium oxidoreducens]SDB12642.1 hypothetical protein SAMN02910417_00964 [Eubacterium oxidoreducens]
MGLFHNRNKLKNYNIPGMNPEDLLRTLDKFKQQFSSGPVLEDIYKQSEKGLLALKPKNLQNAKHNGWEARSLSAMAVKQSIFRKVTNNNRSKTNFVSDENETIFALFMHVQDIVFKTGTLSKEVREGETTKLKGLLGLNEDSFAE